jgi:hypothetical protein
MSDAPEREPASPLRSQLWLWLAFLLLASAGVATVWLPELASDDADAQPPNDGIGSATAP